MRTFLNDDGTHATSIQIMEAIYYIANQDDTLSERIWNCPKYEEFYAIWQRVTQNGNINSREFYWGASGSEWASELNLRHNIN